jgi:ppGpp synthetase/RelA/SpoT-type nucleotidyltranferase
MNFETYERQKRNEYAELAEVIATILTAAIRAQQNLRLQQVQHRAKNPASLRQKLENMGAIGSNSIESQIKDLYQIPLRIMHVPNRAGRST